MGLKGFYVRHENKILASALLLSLLVGVGIRYDYYYDLNDDVTMKDTLAGVYTGVPEGHNIQMLYPLSLAVSLVYRVFPQAPVYGIFLCLCQYGCIWLTAERSLRFGKSTWHKAGMALAEGAVAAALLLPHLVFVQYTFVSAMLAAAAAFLFITSGDGEPGSFIRRNVPAVLLAVLAYMLRTEMLLLLLPLICVAGMYRWSLEKDIFSRDNRVKYLAVIGAILAGMAMAWGINAAAFGSREWKEYVEFFNSRTQLYDFYGIPPYEGNEGLYGDLGLTESGQELLLEQYNFGLEEGLDAEDLDRISEHQLAGRAEKQPFAALLREKLGLYFYRNIHKEPEGSAVPDDYPWNYWAVAGYIAIFLAMAAGAAGKKGKGFYRELGAGGGKLLFLLCVRTALWMFILVRGRDPVRITHSLYWMELCILTAMLCVELAGAQKGEKAGKVFYGALALVLAVTVGYEAQRCVESTDREYEARDAANAVDRGMKGYCRAHPGNFYFMDVYSAVSYPLEPYQSTPYSEKMFAEVDNSIGNYDIMGGWLVKSPSHRKKLEAFGMDSMLEALLYQDNVYIMAELQKGTDAFTSYFRELGVEVQLELTDTVCDLIGVYKIT